MASHLSHSVCVRRVRRAALCAVCAAGMLSHGALAERHGKPAKEGRRAETRDIESMAKQWRTAIVNGDAASMDTLLADDFLAITARGTLMSKEQYISRIATHATKLSSFELMDLKIKVRPRSAVAVSQARIGGMLEGKPIEGVFRYTQVYTRSPAGVWQMTNFEATRVSHEAGDPEQGLPLNSSSASPDTTSSQN